MIRVIAGYDEREAVGYHVFSSSVLRRSTVPVSIAPLHLANLQGYKEHHTDGTNAFIYTRFLIPWMMDFHGMVIFCDGADMLCRADIAELWAWRDPYMAVQVVKHDYQTKSPRKYIGTQMEADNESYPRKNWSSLMIVNCAHYSWRQMNPERVSKMTGQQLHRFEFIQDRYIGDLPTHWNWLVGEYPHDPETRLAHFTLGIPAMHHYKDCDYADEWRTELSHAFNL